jgi:GIY-YIG catalytic domain/NUMOD1 domain
MDINNIGIYKITSPIQRVYIGQSNDIKRRLRNYTIIVKSVEGQVKLHRSLVKYGFKKHVFEVIEYCDLIELNCRERHWQDYYDVTGKNGLNCMLTKCEEIKGQMPKTIYEYINKKVVDTSTGIEYNSITHAANELNLNRRTLSKRLSGQVANITSIVFKKDYIEGQEQRQPDKNRHYKKVINTETGIIYNSITEASKDTHYLPEGLSLKLSKKQKNDTSFMLLDEYEKTGIRKKDSLIIGKWVINTETKQEYRNIKMASKETSINYSSLRNYLNPTNNYKNPTNLIYRD